MAFMEEFHHLEIQLEDIKSATSNFSDNNIIGIGGFGKVYKGSISNSKGQIIVAFKRLDRRYGQGDPEFLKEIMMLSRYKHEHLISLLGFCNEDGEKILVYEHALHGSLDRHLSATSLTWRQRLKICLAAARGVSYLHDPNGTQQRVLHRDIKSSNILLDENWNVKVSDFGLSKIGPANQAYTFLFSNVVGTPGYLDPQYLEKYFLTKESDVYSFGVVLFEVLCGRLCFEYNDGQFHSLVQMWKQSYEQKKLDHIIFQDLKQQMDPSSLEIFSNIAYQCLQKTYEQRPTMARVVEELEIALEIQETYDAPMDYEEMIGTAAPELIYGSQEELNTLISKGVLLNMGRTWFSVNKNGEHYEMISASECLIPIASIYYKEPYSTEYNSRFAMGSYLAFNRKFKTRVRTQFLSPKTAYTVEHEVLEDEKWFYLSKDGKKCHMLPARTSLRNEKLRWCSLPESRFGEAAVLNDWRFSIVSNIKSHVLSPQTTYATYLVYKLLKNHSVSEIPVKVMDKNLSPDGGEVADFWFIYLLSPQTPVIRGKVYQNTHNQYKRPKMKGLPRARNDGWMEVKIWEFRTDIIAVHSMTLELTLFDHMSLKGVIVQGVEFKPI
ncbi:hypothetical protein L1987_33164 [Smallanthus sonchifolius]|uniref:Uncharacterized protein n=1 Tax=Smallanthus sonchifolius TaxID=185202 RepID=A0ACB9HRZ0_9ASTR|nr:hypothetical protein L1987_33164 [Smallanthus sonchifolius]